MNKFKEGDRVVVYDFKNGRVIGTIKEIDWPSSQVGVALPDGRFIYFWSKQCRKLVKKKRLEFWLDFGAITGLHIGNIPISSEPVNGWTKVRECK